MLHALFELSTHMVPLAEYIRTFEHEGCSGKMIYALLYRLSLSENCSLLVIYRRNHESIVDFMGFCSHELLDKFIHDSFVGRKPKVADDT